MRHPPHFDRKGEFSMAGGFGFFGSRMAFFVFLILILLLGSDD